MRIRCTIIYRREKIRLYYCMKLINFWRTVVTRRLRCALSSWKVKLTGTSFVVRNKISPANPSFREIKSPPNFLPKVWNITFLLYISLMVSTLKNGLTFSSMWLTTRASSKLHSDTLKVGSVTGHEPNLLIIS